MHICNGDLLLVLLLELCVIHNYVMQVTPLDSRLYKYSSIDRLNTEG